VERKKKLQSVNCHIELRILFRQLRGHALRLIDNYLCHCNQQIELVDLLNATSANKLLQVRKKVLKLEKATRAETPGRKGLKQNLRFNDHRTAKLPFLLSSRDHPSSPCAYF